MAAIGSLAVDILSKQAIVHNLHVLQSIPLIPNIFHLTYIRNNGAAFSLFQGQYWLRWLSLGVSLGLIVFGIIKSFANIWEQLGFGLILAGAAGNGQCRRRACVRGPVLHHGAHTYAGRESSAAVRP